MKDNENDGFSRREIILAIGGLGAVGAISSTIYTLLPSNNEQVEHGSTILGGKYQIDDSTSIFGYTDHSILQANFLYRINILTDKIEESHSLTGAHSTEPHPRFKNIVCCVMKRSNRISLFDWNSKQEIQSYILPHQQYFNGHAAFSQDGTKILVSGLSLVENILRPKGFIYIFDFPSLKLVDQIVMGGFKAHEIRAIGNNQFVCGLLGENKGHINFGILDLDHLSLKVYSKLIDNFTGYLAINHIAISGNMVSGLGNVIESNSLKNGGLFQFDVNSKEINTSVPIGGYDLKSELLSACFDTSTGYTWVTVPGQQMIFVWDMRKNILVSTIKTSGRPFSLVQASAIDAIVVGTSDGMRVYDRQTLKNRVQKEEKWSALKLNSMSAAHTRII